MIGAEVKPVVVVTGAAGGIGTALVAEFSRQAWTVAAVGHRNPVSARSEATHTSVMDVRNAGQVSACMEEILASLGRIDALVNNAGIIADELLPSLDESAWDRVVDTNLRGAFLCARAVVPAMKLQREGAIINIASLSGKSGTAGQTNYAAAKAGLFGLTHTLAAELGGSASGGIRVNAVLPGFLETPMTKSFSDARRRAMIESNVLKRTNTVEEVARFIVFLAGMRNVSGQLFHLDSRITSWA